MSCSLAVLARLQLFSFTKQSKIVRDIKRWKDGNTELTPEFALVVVTIHTWR